MLTPTQSHSEAHVISPPSSHLRPPSFTDAHRLLQVGDDDTDDQRVDVNVVHAVLRWLGGGPYGLVDGFFAGAVRGTVVGVVRKALGHLILAGGGAPGHSQQARRIQLRHTRRGGGEKRSDSHKLQMVHYRRLALKELRIPSAPIRHLLSL